VTVIERGESKKDVNLRTAQLVQLLTEIGPDIPEIARRLGQFKESVRYRYKEKILNRGFAVQAMPDYEKLGMKRVVMIVDFAPEYRQYASAILTAMNELCYVVNFYKTLPEGEYVVHASVPEEHVGKYMEFMKALGEKGMFALKDMLEFDWFRNPPMRAEHYDFNTGRWDFDWSSSSLPDYATSTEYRSQKQEFDELDLLILKELYMDANKMLAEIAQKLGVNYKKLAWHYKKHVVGRGLIRNYRINWLGTRYDYRLERALQRRHRYVIVDLICRNVTERERMQVMSLTNRIPFLFAEAACNGYYANFGFPLDFVNEALQYLGKIIEPIKTKSSVLIGDQTVALAFTFSYKLFDQDSSKWRFDSQDLLTKFDSLIIKIKEEAG
jgi:DNA-binding Lrp family transcriptional regulator